MTPTSTTRHHRKIVQAKHLPDEVFLAFVASRPKGNAWVFTWDLFAEWPGMPPAVIHAKARRLIKRGLIDGCPCGCRGDFEITDKGRRILGA